MQLLSPYSERLLTSPASKLTFSLENRVLYHHAPVFTEAHHQLVSFWFPEFSCFYCIISEVFDIREIQNLKIFIEPQNSWKTFAPSENSVFTHYIFCCNLARNVSLWAVMLFGTFHKNSILYFMAPKYIVCLYGWLVSGQSLSTLITLLTLTIWYTKPIENPDKLLGEYTKIYFIIIFWILLIAFLISAKSVLNFRFPYFSWISHNVASLDWIYCHPAVSLNSNPC